MPNFLWFLGIFAVGVIMYQFIWGRREAQTQGNGRDTAGRPLHRRRHHPVLRRSATVETHHAQ
jgi:hypothetical protein